MSVKIENCPFCKGNNVQLLSDNPEENFREDKPCFVYCPNCNFESGVYANAKILLNHWNRRD